MYDSCKIIRGLSNTPLRLTLSNLAGHLYVHCMYVCMYPSDKGPAYSGPICWGLFIAGPLR